MDKEEDEDRDENEDDNSVDDARFIFAKKPTMEN